MYINMLMKKLCQHFIALFYVVENMPANMSTHSLKEQTSHDEAGSHDETVATAMF